MNLNTVRPASWNGSSTTASVTIADGAGHNPDYLTVPGTNLGTITFDQDFVDPGQQAQFGGSTIAATSTTYGGRTVTLVTITLSSVTVGSDVPEHREHQRRHALDAVRVGDRHLRKRMRHHCCSGTAWRCRCRLVSC